MSRYPVYLERKQVPDADLLIKIKKMVTEGKSPKKMKTELPGMSLYMISRYYSKIKRGIW